MSLVLAGALVTAGILGVTHAIEPDHVAGIASFTSRYGDSRLSALVGACFSLGHVAYAHSHEHDHDGEEHSHAHAHRATGDRRSLVSWWRSPRFGG